MKVPRPVRPQGVELNLTPMVDVVFLLIIFFLVSSHLARQETQVALALPSAATGIDATAAENARFAIHVQSDGQLLLGSEPTPCAELERRLHVERLRRREPLLVRLRVDERTPYGDVEPVLRALAGAEVRQLEFAVIPTER